MTVAPHLRLALIAPIVLLISTAARSTPAVDELRKLYDDQKYQDVIREASKSLALRGDAARGIDRSSLFVLKAESHLRLRQTSLAADAFSAAAKETDDAGRAAFLRATALLIKRSRNNAYQPKHDATAGKSNQPIDILEESSRRAAIEALYADESADVEARVKSILRGGGGGGNLPGIFDAAALVRGLADLERATTGSDDASRNRLLALGDEAHDLIQSVLKQMSNRIDAIARRANEKHRVGDNVYAKRGLGRGDAEALQNIKDTSDKIPQAAERLLKDLGTDPDRFKDCTDEAMKVGERAHAVQIMDYTGLYGEP
jgi:hypothetical protein